MLLSIAGNFFGDESAAQTVQFAGSSVALATGAARACVSLARGPHGRAAAGFGILVVAEGLLWTGGAAGPGSHTALAAGELFYAPALGLIATTSWPPVWSRVAGGAAALSFGLHALLFEAAAHPSDTLSDAGFVLLAVTVAGWIVGERRPLRT
ncbi:MAG: hypothetical protein ACR2K9_06605 [Solirubrobacteraceae bacterium]